MKKRFVCALLALVLLVGMVPVTAAAADNKVSEAAVTVLKQMTPIKFNSEGKSECYFVSGSEYRIGYGTVCQEKHHFNVDGTPKASENVHTISQRQADTALRKELGNLDEKVSKFASQNGLTLTQNQHDALVVYSYGAGSAWLTGTGALKSAIVSKAGANELLNVMKNLSKTDAEFARNQVVVNMYINGVYSNTIPNKYKTVTYDANGGKIAQGDGNTYTMQFDADKTVDHIKATNGSQILLGWYTAGGEWMPKLNADCADETLYAHWQDGYSGSVAEATDYTVAQKELASTTVYAEPDTKANKLSVKASGTVQIDNDYIDKSGNRWGYSSELGGWVRIGASKADAVASNVIATAVVTYNGYLNVRDGAGTDNKIVGALSKNDTVNIYQIKTVNGHRWGKCDAGWICLTYTTLTMVDGKTASDDGVAAYAFTGKVTADVDVYVAAGDANAQVAYEDEMGYSRSYIPAGTKITISSLTVAPCGADKATWARVTWKNPEKDKNDKDITVTRSGWIPISLADSPLGDALSFGVTLDPVEYTVVAESTNVRQAAGDAAALAFTLNKNVRVEVSLICLMNENIWGKMTVVDAVQAGTVGANTGWINLASKYVKRSSEIKLEEEKETSKGEHDSGKIATVTNTDTVRVRKAGALYGAVIGSLNRGATVKVWNDKSKYDDWYKVDSNKNGVYDYDGDGWVYGQYLDVREGTLTNDQTVTDASGNTVTTDGTGTGVVANTYSGVNVRQGAGIGYAAVGKLLPGTQVEILEVKTGGAAKWGRTEQGWVCMDYIAMVKYNPVTPEETVDPSKGTAVDSFDTVEKTTTTAVYTGNTISSCTVYKEPLMIDAAENPEEYSKNVVKNLALGENVTIHELAEVTQKVKSDKDSYGDSNTVTTVTTTTYWARINEGWILDPESNLELTALDEKLHTLTGADTLKVRASASQSSEKIDVLEKGDQVKVTALQIENDKVWGRIETDGGTGWIRLDYMSEGAYYVKETKPTEPSTTPSAPVMGSTGNTGTGMTNSSGYRYTGKVINANEVNVRATASTSAKKTTTLKNGASLVIYETTISENMAWGRCDAGWVYLYYVDLTPCVSGAVDARVVYNDNTVAYTDVNCTTVAGTYTRMSVVDIYEIVGKMAKTDLGWINTDNLL